MKNRVLTIILFMLLLVVLVGCSSSPDGAVKGFLKALDKGKIDEAMGYLSTSALSTLGRDKWQSVLASAADEIQSKGGISSVDITDKKVHGDIATVTVKITYGDGSSEVNTIDLIKENGDWKIQITP